MSIIKRRTSVLAPFKKGPTSYEVSAGSNLPINCCRKPDLRTTLWLPQTLWWISAVEILYPTHRCRENNWTTDYTDFGLWSLINNRSLRTVTDPKTWTVCFAKLAQFFRYCAKINVGGGEERDVGRKNFKGQICHSEVSQQFCSSCR